MSEINDSLEKLEMELTANGKVVEIPDVAISAEELLAIKQKERHQLALQFQTLKLRENLCRAIGDDTFAEKHKEDAIKLLKAIHWLDTQIAEH